MLHNAWLSWGSLIINPSSWFLKTIWIADRFFEFLRYRDGIFKIARCRLYSDELARTKLEATWEKFSVSRGNPCVLENDKILNLPIKFIYSCSCPRLSRFTFIDETDFHFYVPYATPIASKQINPPWNSFARTAGTLSLVFLKRYHSYENEFRCLPFYLVWQII